MNLVGLMPVRNEDWIIGISARVALMWCDRLVILNHASTDRTGIILNELATEFGKRLFIFDIPHPEWDEMKHRQMMLSWARVNVADWTAATHIALVDADEILTGNLLSGIREQVAALSLGEMLTLPLYNLRGSLNRYHLNGLWGQRTISVAFKDVNTAGWKGDTYHHREPAGVNWTRQKFRGVNQGQGGVMHLWGVSERRLLAKHALYQIAETLRYPEKDRAHLKREYRQCVDGRPWIGEKSAEWTFATTPANWWSGFDAMAGDYIHLDAEPWQEAEVRRLVAEHGRERFEGLDLFGLA